MDNYAAHKCVEVRDWAYRQTPRPRALHPGLGILAQPRRDLVRIIDRQAIHRGTFGSVREINAKIRAFITVWNDSKPLVPSPRHAHGMGVWRWPAVSGWAHGPRTNS